MCTNGLAYIRCSINVEQRKRVSYVVQIRPDVLQPLPGLLETQRGRTVNSPRLRKRARHEKLDILRFCCLGVLSCCHLVNKDLSLMPPSDECQGLSVFLIGPGFSCPRCWILSTTASEAWVRRAWALSQCTQDSDQKMLSEPSFGSTSGQNSQPDRNLPSTPDLTASGRFLRIHFLS